ncbi:MAG: sigma-70 family RNA polymerase sigma factor [Verrucomicrobiota bacterium]
MDDWPLLEKYAKTQDPAAFSALVDRHLGLVYATALRISGDPAAADDISQATFILLEEKADLLKPGGSLASWLYQSAVFKARKHVTKERIRREREAKGAEFMTPTQPETAENEWNEIRPLIDTALESLGEEDRGIMISRHLQQMSLKDAGTVLGISEDAAGKRVARAGVRLRDWFESRGIRCTSDVLGGALGSFAMVSPPQQLADQIVLSAIGSSAGAATAHATREAVSNWLSSRTAMVAAFAMAAASPAAISVVLPETNEMTKLEAAGMPGDSSTGRAAPLTTEESEWIALWKNHAPPRGSFPNLMAAIWKIEDPLKRDVFKVVAYSEWVDKRLPIPGNLQFAEAVPLFEQMLAKDPVRAGEMAASFNTDPKTPRYLGISSKLASLVGSNPETLANFINLVAIPSNLVSNYGISSYQSMSIALPPQSDNARAGHIRDAIALLAERNPTLAEATVDSLRGWHREQALAGLIVGRTGMDLDAAITALAQRSEAPGVKENVLEPLLKKWIEIDPRKTLEALEQLQKGNGPMTRVPSGKLSSSLLRSDLLAVYAERDFAGCMTYLTESGSGMDGADKLYAVIAGQLRENPGQTLDAMEKLENKPGMKPWRNWTYYIDQDMAPMVWDWCASREPDAYVRSVAYSVLSAFADKDPALAIDLYLQNPDLASQFPSSEIAHVLNIYSVDDAHRILGKLPDKEREDTIYAMLRSKDFDWDVTDCLPLYESLKDRHRDIPAGVISARLAEADPQAAVTWALSQPEGQIRNLSVSGLIGSWAESDPVAAAEWVNGLESGDLRDTASWNLADELADQGDFLSAIAWSSSGSDQKRRLELIESILTRAAKSQPAGTVESLMDSAGLSNIEKRSLHDKILSKK